MGAKRLRQYVGHLPGIGTPISSSAQCIVYDHIRQEIYVSTDNADVARDVAYAQRRRDKLGHYRVYQFIDDVWYEFGLELGRRPRRRAGPPPLFLLWWCNLTTVFSLLF